MNTACSYLLMFCRFSQKGRLFYLSLMGGLIGLAVFGATGNTLASEPIPQTLEPGSYRVTVGNSGIVWGFTTGSAGSIARGSTTPNPATYMTNERRYTVTAVHANADRSNRQANRRSIRCLLTRVGGDAVVTDAPDRITLTSNGQTIALERVARATFTIRDIGSTIEADYGAPGAADTDAARNMLIGHRGATVDVTLLPRDRRNPITKTPWPPDTIGSLLQDGLPSVNWRLYPADPTERVEWSQFRFRRLSTNPRLSHSDIVSQGTYTDPPWTFGDIVAVNSASSGRSSIPVGFFEPDDSPPWGTFMVSMRVGNQNPGDNSDIRWSRWNLYIARYHPAAPLAPILLRVDGTLRIEVEPHVAADSYQARYRPVGTTHYQGDNRLNMDSPTGEIPVSDLPIARAEYEAQARYIAGNIPSRWSPVAKETDTPISRRPVLIRKRRALDIEIPRADGATHYEARYRSVGDSAWIPFSNLREDEGVEDKIVGTIGGLADGTRYQAQARYRVGTDYSRWSMSAIAATLPPAKTFSFTGIFVTEGLHFGPDGMRDTQAENNAGTGDDIWRYAGTSRGEGFGSSRLAWPDSSFTPATYEHDFEQLSVTAFQWGNRIDSFSPAKVGEDDLIIRGEGHYSATVFYPFTPRPITDEAFDDFEVVINGRSYGRTEPLYWNNWNLWEATYAEGYVRGIRGAAADLRRHVPLNTPVTVEFRYSAGN